MANRGIMAELAALRMLLLGVLVDRARAAPEEVAQARSALASLLHDLDGRADGFERDALERALGLLDQARSLAGPAGPTRQ